MNSEFQLSFSASDIDRRLSKVDNLVASVNGVSPDINGNVNIEIGSSSGGSAIIDVLELPTENINNNVFYRVLTAKWIVEGNEVTNGSVCYCVNNLPESGRVVTDMNMSIFNGYYNLMDNEIYGYVDTMLGSAFSVPAGWYTFNTLAQVAQVGFNGIVTDIDDLPTDNSYFGVLLSKDFYIYQDGWCKVPFACEKVPKFDIQWDGVIGNKFNLDMSALGFTGISITKISDTPILANQIVGCYAESTYLNGDTDVYNITEDFIDTNTYPGGITINNGEIVSVYDADEANAALGLPTGYLTNGLYFYYNSIHGCWTSRLTAPSKVIKIDEKYLPDMSVDINSLGLHSVATSGNYNDLWNKPNMNNYVTTSTLNSRLNSYITSSQVDTKIANAIGSAIGGEY